jgi:hypothetical protein
MEDVETTILALTSLLQQVQREGVTITAAGCCSCRGGGGREKMNTKLAAAAPSRSDWGKEEEDFGKERRRTSSIECNCAEYSRNGHHDTLPEEEDGRFLVELAQTIWSK